MFLHQPLCDPPEGVSPPALLIITMVVIVYTEIVSSLIRGKYRIIYFIIQIIYHLSNGHLVSGSVDIDFAARLHPHPLTSSPVFILIPKLELLHELFFLISQPSQILNLFADWAFICGGSRLNSSNTVFPQPFNICLSTLMALR